ncbi:MAG: CHAP domain-containing protein [Sphingobium sp.]
MRIARRLITVIALPMLAWGVIPSPVRAADVLQCVPYARELSGIRIHGDAWTWWEQARGHYQRGRTPRPGAVLSLANTEAMPLGHVAVVSHIVDERRILLRHANWSRPGLIETDVMAIDASPENDWSEVRIWWGQGQQMGARLNPANGFIYPGEVNRRAVLKRGDDFMPDASDSGEDVDDLPARQQRVIAATSASFTRPMQAKLNERTSQPKLAIDLRLLREDRELAGATARQSSRTLAMIVRDVRREARLTR